MVTHPRRYRWSSCRANAEGKNDDLIAPHEQYRRLGGSDEARRQAYRELIRERLDDSVVSEIRLATNGGFVLGDARFAAALARMLRRRVLRSKPGRPRHEENGTAKGQANDGARASAGGR